MALSYADQLWLEQGYGTRIQGFQNLMRRRIRDILLVSSLYDLYLFEEDGRLYELIRNEYQGLSLSHSPEITRVSSGEEAISLAKEERRFDLIMTTLHVEDMTALRLASRIREEGLDIPIVLLAYDNRELKDLLTHRDTSVFDGIFIWQGDFRLLIGIIKMLEDRMNVDHDTQIVGVQCVILIEDNVRYYSSYLPLIYSEMMNQSQRLISEGVNLPHRYLRMRARPKILLCTTYEQALEYFNKYQEHVLGVISDVDFPKDGVPNPRAGLEFASEVKSRYDDIPILLQSTTPAFERETRQLGASFLLKDSPTLLLELRQFITQYFSFGDFVFRTPDGHEVARATDLRSLEDCLKHVPAESIRYHAERNHFSNWLKARTEFWLAHQLRPRRVSDYASLEDLREDLIRSLQEYRRLRQRGIITDFTRETFDPESSFARIGSGSLGGKARGLGFVNVLVNSYGLRDRFEGVRTTVPAGVVIGTEIFDRFLDANKLRTFALASDDDSEIMRRFVQAEHFPEEVARDLASFLELIREPLAVRSSSLLEDSQYHPFAGVYQTYMIPNNDEDPARRLQELITTVKRVYASTFFHSAKDYIRVTSYRLEEEKMAVIIQKMVGQAHGSRFYPDFAGVAKSYNFYPVAPQKPQDGVVSVALGLGKTIVDGGITVRFCPKYPNHLLQFFSTREALRNNQKEFYALDLLGEPPMPGDTVDVHLKRHGLETAEQDGTLHLVASTYSAENDRMYPGTAREGIRVVSFAPVLQTKLIPLPQILEELLALGSWGMGTAVEIEFAVNMSVREGAPKQFGLLQMRPLVLSRETEELELGFYPQEQLVCESQHVLGNGAMRDICDAILVVRERFDRSRTLDVAREVMEFNEALIADGRPYLLVGMGRWGSLDPWLGIPVKWDQISGARAIIETGFEDIDVEPSQGSHFFQNITSFMVGYFTVSHKFQDGFVDWEWLGRQRVVAEKHYVRHVRFEHPIIVKMNGHINKGIILKPEM